MPFVDYDRPAATMVRVGAVLVAVAGGCGVAAALSTRTANAVVLGVFAAVALALAVTGYRRSRRSLP